MTLGDHLTYPACDQEDLWPGADWRRREWGVRRWIGRDAG